MSVWSSLSLAIGSSLILGGSFIAARGAARLSHAGGFSSFARSLVFLGFAASLPELAIAWRATGEATDLSDLALGDVVGGVIGNYLLALAVAALALPLVISTRLLQFAFPLALLASLATLAAAWTGEITTVVGTCLLLSALIWPVASVVLDRRDAVPRNDRKRDRSKRIAAKPAEPEPKTRQGRDLLIAALSCFLGAVAVYFGARWLLACTPQLADVLRLDESTCGLTVLALATTLPEAIICLLLTLRGDREGAVGVVVGSSLFNLTAALGLAAIRSPEGLEVPAVVFEMALPVAIAAGLACVPPFYGRRHLSRGSGLALFAFYVAFFVYATIKENWYPSEDPDETQQARFYAMFLIAIGLIVVLSLIAMIDRLAQKARLADE